ncbi:hypothetical protein [Paenibacillus sp. Soil750]|uniref:hypothetical protein n=1 Tax=Paenibacillus sp. Soil750 TaxID=1736398 RepID=UPI000AB70B5F|nr:hypothetical protein [Paenibacillus sp. Soil750]
MIIILYIQYEVEPNEGLCNQLMGIFRTIGEALYYSHQHDSISIIINDLQTRTSSDTTDFDVNFSKIAYDSFVDVDELTHLLLHKNILVRRPQEVNNHIQNNIISCRRYSHRQLLPDESREMGIFIANSFPFAKNILKIANCIIGLMSLYPSWKVIQLRIEEELMNFFPGYEKSTSNQLQETINMISNTPDLSAIYFASGIREEKYNAVAQSINHKFPNLITKNKHDILKNDPEIKKELDALCLEEQALVDWLVCVGAPSFAGPHATSFAYLAGYMRHYRGFAKETTHLWPEYTPYWDIWFPRV